jgi:hypothetical protein
MARFSRGEGPPGGIERREHALTESDKDWIVQAITKYHNCPFGEDDFRAVKKILDIHQTIGDGDLNKGVERFREHSRFMQAVLTKKSVLAGVGLAGVFGTVSIAFFWWMLESVRCWVLTGGK